MIRFLTHECTYVLRKKRRITLLIKSILEEHGKRPGDINFVMVGDEYLLQVNKDFLAHEYNTDVITFPGDYKEGFVSGDILISVDRVRENCLVYQVTEENEMLRVMVHGILHLLGYDDTSSRMKQAMEKKQEEYVAQYFDCST